MEMINVYQINGVVIHIMIVQMVQMKSIVMRMKVEHFHQHMEMNEFIHMYKNNIQIVQQG